MQWLPPRTLHSIMQAAFRKQRNGTLRWATACGPAAATVASSERIGWSFACALEGLSLSGRCARSDHRRIADEICSAKGPGFGLKPPPENRT